MLRDQRSHLGTLLAHPATWTNASTLCISCTIASQPSCTWTTPGMTASLRCTQRPQMRTARRALGVADHWDMRASGAQSRTRRRHGCQISRGGRGELDGQSRSIDLIRIFLVRDVRRQWYRHLVLCTLADVERKIGGLPAQNRLKISEGNKRLHEAMNEVAGGGFAQVRAVLDRRTRRRSEEAAAGMAVLSSLAPWIERWLCESLQHKKSSLSMASRMHASSRFLVHDVKLCDLRTAQDGLLRQWGLRAARAGACGGRCFRGAEGHRRSAPGSASRI